VRDAVGKARFGETGTVRLRMDPSTGRIVPLAQEGATAAPRWES
jgi:hypothetical protein